MDSKTLTDALLESAWLSARVAVAFGFAIGFIGPLWVRLRTGAARRQIAASGPAAHSRPGAPARVAAQAAAFVLGCVLIAWTRGEAQRLLPAWAQSLVAAVAAITALVSGMLRAWTSFTLGERLVFPAEARAGAPLLTTGPFGIVRHPFYLSIALWGGAAGLALGSLSGSAALIALFLAASAWRARLEDRVLAEAYPEAFPAYAARVRAFAPRI
jgi:protein-S-isoprenylcysteine O-methyltransferase Ste14